MYLLQKGYESAVREGTCNARKTLSETQVLPAARFSSGEARASCNRTEIWIIREAMVMTRNPSFVEENLLLYLNMCADMCYLSVSNRIQ